MDHRRPVFVIVAIAVFALLTVVSVSAPTAAGLRPARGKVELHLFWLSTCPHCAAARSFLAELKTEVPELIVYEHEVSSDREAQQLFVEMVDERGGRASVVPTIIIGDKMWTGFDHAIAASIRNEVLSLAGRGASTEPTESAYVDVPFFGDVDVASSSLLVSTVVIAFVDGVNPCSLWVLSILLALVLHSGSRRRVALVGSTFLFITAALYGLYMIGVYSLLNYASYLSWIQRAVAAVVGVFAVVNLRDYFRAGQRSPLSIPESAAGPLDSCEHMKRLLVHVLTRMLGNPDTRQLRDASGFCVSKQSDSRSMCSHRSRSFNERWIRRSTRPYCPDGG